MQMNQAIAAPRPEYTPQGRIQSARTGVMETIESVLSRLKSPRGIDKPACDRLCADLTEMREIVEYLYSPYAETQMDEESFRYLDDKIAVIRDTIAI
jgi:hypothetical protein